MREERDRGKDRWADRERLRNGRKAVYETERERKRKIK